MRILAVLRNVSNKLVLYRLATLHEINVYDRLINPESVVGSRRSFVCK